MILNEDKKEPESVQINVKRAINALREGQQSSSPKLLR
jgi:hypothetical protein